MTAIRCLGVAAASLLAGLSARPVQAMDVDCLLEPAQTVELRSPVSGLIDKVLAERGQAVKRGAPLVLLESSVERAAVDLAAYKSQLEGPLKSTESRIQHAQAKLRRRTGLAEQNYGSMQDKEDAEAELGSAQADAQIARENKQLARLEQSYASAQLALRTLRSPIDGVVVDQARFAGELVEGGENKPYILKIAQSHPLRVKMILPAALFGRISPGMKAEVMHEKPAQGRYTATVINVDKSIDGASGSFQVRMDLPNPNGELPGGLKCKASLPGL